MLNNKHVAAALLAAASFLPVVAQAQSLGCEAKKENLLRQLGYAKMHGNVNRVAGLERAYARVSARCTNGTWRSDFESDLRKKERKVAEAREELAEARATGRSDKIRKKTRKLEDAQHELAEVRTEWGR